jgi:hypothetical protein
MADACRSQFLRASGNAELEYAVGTGFGSRSVNVAPRPGPAIAAVKGPSRAYSERKSGADSPRADAVYRRTNTPEAEGAIIPFNAAAYGCVRENRP